MSRQTKWICNRHPKTFKQGGSRQHLKNWLNDTRSRARRETPFCFEF